MRKFIFSLLLVFNSTYLNAEPLTFAVVPQQSPTKLAKLWQPIIEKISQQTGLSIKFATAPNIPTFEKRLAQGKYDIAYMNPYHFVVFNQSLGYQAIAKAKNKRIKGIIVVAKKSPITQLSELNNATLAFPAPAAFAASILTQSELSQHQVKFTAKYVSSHDSVYLTVAKGIYPAGGGILRTFNNVSADIKAKLRVLHTTPGYTPHAIAVHPRINAQRTEKIQQALINLTDDEQGERLINNINIKGFQGAVNKDWDDVRNLNLSIQVTQ